MKIINIKNWTRKTIFNFYKNFNIPRYQVTVEINIKKYYDYLKLNQIPIYFGIMHLILSEMNQIDNFKYRIKDDDVILHDTLHPSFTDRIGDGDTFKIVTGTYAKDLKTFCDLAKQASLEQGDKFIDYRDELRSDLVYVSSFPWAKYTQVSNATMTDASDAVQRILWGKFEKKDDQMLMPLTIEVHHALVDGYHLGLLIQNFETTISKI